EARLRRACGALAEPVAVGGVRRALRREAPRAPRAPLERGTRKRRLANVGTHRSTGPLARLRARRVVRGGARGWPRRASGDIEPLERTPLAVTRTTLLRKSTRPVIRTPARPH